MFAVMNLLPFGELPAFKARGFVPVDLNFDEGAQLTALYDRLAARAPECATLPEFERWLLDWSELNAAVEQDASKRYIAMTCHTDNAEAETTYLRFVEEIQPLTKPREFQLAQSYLAHPCRPLLPRPRYTVLDRDLQLQVELFRPENVPLETEDAKLSQQYQKLSGSLTVNFRGEEKTLVQMGRFLEETDRALRQEAWELVANRRLAEADQFEEIFDQLVVLRQQIARNAGFENYLAYAFRARGRFDYSPADCVRFHEAIETELMPVVRELQAARKTQLALPSLRPWDLSVDPLNQPPLRPFEQVDGMVATTQKVFADLDAGLAAEFQDMRDRSLLDLANRKGKAPGGYQCSLPEARLPFIFMNAVGVQRDVETLLHEAGHAFHALATRGEDLYPYRSAPIEFCEVASMSMELLGNEFIEHFYAAPQARRARRDHLEGIVKIFPWIATVDAFQHWVYAHPGHTRAERRAAWEQLMDRFGGTVDWTGYADARGHLWHRQLHIFTSPFYYVEYGIAQLGALQVWANSKQDRAAALGQYKAALALGGSRPLPELFAAAGCRFEFSGATMRPLVRLLQTELAKLN